MAQRKDRDRYPPIGDYAMIGDCHPAALGSRTGSIDWLGMPRMDGGSSFARLLDWERGGYCSIEAAGTTGPGGRGYVGDWMGLRGGMGAQSRGGRPPART